MAASPEKLQQLLNLAEECGIQLKVYKVRMNETYVRALTILAELTDRENPPGGWLQLGQEKRGKVFQHDLNHMKYSKLRFWGLIEKGTESGVWRVTLKGRKFLAGEETISAVVKELRAQPVGFSQEQVDVHQACGRQFDYRQETRPTELV